MSLVKLKSYAPTRIDLAGGTVDIWPLYLLLRKACTINLGINLFAETSLEENTESNQVELVSQDQGHRIQFKWSEISSIKPHPALELHWKLLSYFYKQRSKLGAHNPAIGLRISTRALSPAGAGLGGSSTLSVSLVGCLARWALGNDLDFLRDGDKFIEIVKDIETTVIRVPAGLQDYYGAMYGGLQKLEWNVGTHSRSWMPGELLPHLQDRLLLFYSGQSRNSGINNWVLYKDFIDGKSEVQLKFENLMLSTEKLEKALSSENWIQVGEAISQEWEIRRTLAAGISTPIMEEAFLIAKKLGATAFKVCGAGGGGCFFLYFPSPIEGGVQQELFNRFLERGIKSLPFSIVPHGLQVQEQ